METSATVDMMSTGTDRWLMKSVMYPALVTQRSCVEVILETPYTKLIKIKLFY